MFSEELLELDRNTVEFMIEDMRRQIEEMKPAFRACYE